MALGKDLSLSQRIRQLVLSDIFAILLYGALCNTHWRHVLTGARWQCSWCHAGAIVAMLRGEGDYMDWYCSMDQAPSRNNARQPRYDCLGKLPAEQTELSQHLLINQALVSPPMIRRRSPAIGCRRSMRRMTNCSMSRSRASTLASAAIARVDVQHFDRSRHGSPTRPGIRQCPHFDDLATQLV
jgi:hypothetical protein